MSLDSKPHVFVSCVREDRHAVERLCAEFKRSGVAVWLDREKIRPGERWQIAIRRAIEQGAPTINTSVSMESLSMVRLLLTGTDHRPFRVKVTPIRYFLLIF